MDVDQEGMRGIPVLGALAKLAGRRVRVVIEELPGGASDATDAP